MRQRRAAVSRRNHGNHHLIDVHFKFVLMFGGKMAKCKYDREYLKCGFSYTEDKKGQKPQCVTAPRGSLPLLPHITTNAFTSL